LGVQCIVPTPLPVRRRTGLIAMRTPPGGSRFFRVRVCRRVPQSVRSSAEIYGAWRSRHVPRILRNCPDKPGPAENSAVNDRGRRDDVQGPAAAAAAGPARRWVGGSKGPAPSTPAASAFFRARSTRWCPISGGGNACLESAPETRARLGVYRGVSRNRLRALGGLSR